MFFLIQQTRDGNFMRVISETESRHYKSPEGMLNFWGHKVTSRMFESELEAVRYCERLLEQNNIPLEIRVHLRTFCDKFYNKESFILDVLDNEYEPRSK